MLSQIYYYNNVYNSKVSTSKDSMILMFILYNKVKSFG